MQDREMVAAIAAGDPAGLAEAYDRYGATLYAYCRSMLPHPDPADNASDAVRDTFIIATSRLQGLRDPDLLGPWLHAVARNECLRRGGGAGGVAGGAGGVAGEAGGVAGEAAELSGRRDPDGREPAVMLPAGLREQVLEACADNTPSGRAYRVSVTHRAGPFGRTGFPRSIVPLGPAWWHEVRRHPSAAAGVAAVAVAVVAAGIVAILMAGGPHRAQASALALGGGIYGAASASAPGASSSPGHKVQLAKGTPAPSVSGSTATSQAAAGKPKPSTPAPSSSGSSGSSPTPSPSPSPSPGQGTLTAAPTRLALTAAAGKAVTGTFLVTAVGGPVDDWVIEVPAGVATKVTVSPSSGSLKSDGAWVSVTVTVKSKVSFSTRLTVDPGGLIVTVVFTIKA